MFIPKKHRHLRQNRSYPRHFKAFRLHRYRALTVNKHTEKRGINQ